jgi:hypothetical protein
VRSDPLDDLALGLAGGISRRQALKLLGGGLAGSLLGILGGVGEAAVGECKRNGNVCKNDWQCCSGKCEGGTCAECVSNSISCTADSECCSGICSPTGTCCSRTACTTTIDCCSGGICSDAGICLF